jgi:hypothetical protein
MHSTVGLLQCQRNTLQQVPVRPWIYYL